MKTYNLKLKSIDHKKHKHKCNMELGEDKICGKDAIAYIYIKTKWINLKEKEVIKKYLCDECASKICKELLEELNNE